MINLNEAEIVYQTIFGQYQTKTLLIQDIVGISLSSAFWFGGLKFIQKDNKDEPIEIRFLKRADAVRVKKLLQGLITAKKQGVSLHRLIHISTKELIKKLEKLGEVEEK